MYLKKRTIIYMKKNLELLDRIKTILNHADAILIGAGSGLSAAAGYNYSGERFTNNFLDFHKKYGISDIYSGGFYPYMTSEEYWAWWSRQINLNRYIEQESELHKKLLRLLDEKEYFVLTTNVDHLFQSNNFDKNRLFYTQGDYGLFQCSIPCHKKTYDNKDIVKKMVNHQREMKIPTELIPRCPICSSEMTMNLRVDHTFVQDSGWYKADSLFNNFVEKYRLANVVFLELGVGYNSPGVIKYPFWRMTNSNPNAKYISVNLENEDIPKEIYDKTIHLKMNISDFIDSLL